MLHNKSEVLVDQNFGKIPRFGLAIGLIVTTLSLLDVVVVNSHELNLPEHYNREDKIVENLGYAAIMSIATKRKYVIQEVQHQLVLPDEQNKIVKITGSRGNYLHDVEDSDGETYLVSMPSKFRNNVWIKRGDFVMTIPIEEGDKVKGEICNILYKEQIKHIQKNGCWPEAFLERKAEGKNQMIPDDMLPPSDDESDEDSESGDDSPMVANPNRPRVHVNEDNTDSEEEEEGR